MNSFDTTSIKNSMELIGKLQGIKLNSDERIVSFDIVSYFLNVPKSGALAALKEWLDKQNIDPLERTALYELTEVCINQSYFQFRGNYYKQNDGLAMGLSLSPFLCNLYMNTIEKRLQKSALFPRFYCRYVDDCFAVVNATQINETLELFNSVCPEIQFTIEPEVNNTLPFLDLKIIRNENGNIEFDIYRKDTCTDRFIPVESNQHPSHKLAAFNSMIHRLVNVTLTPERFEIERSKILGIADINGVNASVIDILIKKHKKKKLLHDCTSLGDAPEKKWCAMTFSANTFDSLCKSFRKEDIALAPKTTTKLKSLLHTTKDKRDAHDKPGIYKASCADCDAVYIGQTRRSLKVRKREHLSYIHNIEAYRSGLAEHIITQQHSISDENFKLIETESNANRLNVLESLHIHRNRNNVNRDTGPHYSSLFTALKR